MDQDLFLKTKELLENNYSASEIRDIMSRKGLLESDIDLMIQKAVPQVKNAKVDSHKKIVSMISFKEIFDRVGYGFVSHPFINILFSFSGASFFLIGLFNGLRMILSLIFASFLSEFSKIQDLKKSFISRSGMLFGFSFLFMSFAVVLKSPALYAIAFLVGGIGVVAHGEIYTRFLSKNTKREHTTKFLLNISKYGILITIVAMIASGYIIDLFPIMGEAVTFSLFGNDISVKIYGYLISFELTALAFILSGLILSYVKQKDFVKSISMQQFIPRFIAASKVHSGFFFKNKAVLLLTLASLITGLVQMLGNSFYGIFIFNHFKDSYFGGFLNVAIVFGVAALFSLIGPWFTQKLKHHIGVSPMLVFGTLLTAMLPLSLSFNPNFYVIIVASAFSIVGASIMGMAQGFFAKKLLTQEQRSIYFSFLGVVLALPLLVFTLAGSYIAQLDLVLLFKIILGVVVLIATPIYFFMVLIYEKQVETHF